MAFNPTLGFILIFVIPAAVTWVVAYVDAKRKQEREREQRMWFYRGVQYGRKDQSR